MLLSPALGDQGNNNLNPATIEEDLILQREQGSIPVPVVQDAEDECGKFCQAIAKKSVRESGLEWAAAYLTVSEC